MQSRLSLIGLVCEDVARSLAFYRALGLEIPEDADDQVHVEVNLPGGLRLAWDSAETVRGFYPNWTPPAGSPRMALAFELDSPAEVDKLHEKMVSLGYENVRDPWDAFWGQRYALLHDPDGNSVELFAPLGN